MQLNPCTALRMKRRTWSLEQGPVVNKAKYSSMAEYMMGAAGLHQILGKREGKGSGSQGGRQKDALLESSQEGRPAAALEGSATAWGADPLKPNSSSGPRGTQGRGGKLPPLQGQQPQRVSSPEQQIPSWFQAASPTALQASQPLPPAGHTAIDMPDKHVSLETFLPAEDSQSLLPGSAHQ